MYCPSDFTVSIFIMKIWMFIKDTNINHEISLKCISIYRVDFLIYQDVGRSPFKVTENNYPKTLMLSFTHGNHYDIVYKKEEASLRGFCQCEFIFCTAKYELLNSEDI